MIEVVFNESAGGSLKCAQHFGKGRYRGVSALFLIHADGSEATTEELAQAKKEYEAKERVAWEQAEPLGGTANDVFCFGLCFSVGEITEELPGKQRQEALEKIWVTIDASEREHLAEPIMRAKESLENVHKRASEGEPIRVWCSNQPDEMCGMMWFMSQLIRMGTTMDQLQLVRLPELEEINDKKIQHRSSWGELDREDWHRFVRYQQPVSKNIAKWYALEWRRLQDENALLRAVINGRVYSVPEEFYDPFILREIEAQKGEFLEARLIGDMIGKYQLGIGDGWIHARIEKMIQDGKVAVASKGSKKNMLYRRMLVKCGQ